MKLGIIFAKILKQSRTSISQPIGEQAGWEPKIAAFRRPLLLYQA